MKTRISLSILLAVLFVTMFLNSQTYAGDKWKGTSIYHSGPLKLSGEDLLFRITIKNSGDKRSKGDAVSVTLKLYGGNTEIGTKTITITPSLTDIGGTYTFDVSVPVPSGLVYQKIEGTLKSDTNLDGITETFTVQKIR